MKHPILHIKKDAERDTEFYYKRELRLARSRIAQDDESPPRRVPIRTFKRGKRTPLISLFLLAIAALIFFKSNGRMPDKGIVDGWDVVLRATPYQDAVLVSVGFSRNPKARPVELPVAASVRFLLPDSGEQVFVSEQIVNDRAMLRGKLPYTGREKKAEAEVTVGGKAKKLSKVIKKP